MMDFFLDFTSWYFVSWCLSGRTHFNANRTLGQGADDLRTALMIGFQNVEDTLLENKNFEMGFLKSRMYLNPGDDFHKIRFALRTCFQLDIVSMCFRSVAGDMKFLCNFPRLQSRFDQLNNLYFAI
jgi:hypothetical protein